ncbi:MAG: 3-methyl-2-oxobutanoate hydroxymethyltransferase [Blastopirellula sp.]|nr:3-methyl-2-oxobutanoate hydroxymethyltransferase [Blastopirellula sp.]
MSSMDSQPTPITVPAFQSRKDSQQRITMLTAYDFPTAQLLDQAGVDCLLVGDSLGMVVQGKTSTVPVTLDEIIYHAEMVVRGAQRAMVLVDMPFLTYQVSVQAAIENAGRILKETGCAAVKLEGSAAQADTIRALVTAGIPVMAHVGLRPQSVNQTGYKVQRDRDQLVQDAHAAEDAGAFSVLIECVPSDIAAEITRQLRVPTIGIGAGPDCDGQVLVTPDLLGITCGYVPRFVKRYADLGSQIREAVTSYVDDVRNGSFPANEQSYQ